MADQPTTLSALLAEHEYVVWSSGDGYHVPHEDALGCSCGVLYWQHIEHADCGCDWDDSLDAPQRHAEHIIAMAIRARLARSRGGVR
ncbi:hypothetical protein SEA_FINKLE_73 [Gordonia phage Finkle]|uniref:Uncharacterized protein n=1 Tax=Gordonia phage Finkle TaxID=2926099 RepID=A0A9E7NJ29_9CAUD|nr:hypothetical protein QEH33_gp73 [Gordonia phage Finkle]UTN92987.1 hypothetical protein SEA_FINKLE_73 [Gordonia phage Finkle]